MSGGWSLGTGTWLGDGLILSARHVVQDAEGNPLPQVRVRRVGGVLCDATVVWTGTADLDAVLLAVTADTAGRWEAPAGLAPLRWGWLCGQGTRVDAQVTGFPDSVTPNTTAMREVEQADGLINPLAGSRAEQYLMTPGLAPHAGAGPGEASLWKGVSGGGVICGDLLCGVVIEAPPAFDNRRLVIIPAHVLARDEAFRTLVERATGHRMRLEAAELQDILTPWYPARAPVSPAALLRPEYETVPFRPRPELDQLRQWCDSPATLSGLLVTGVGGQGKSRLARQLAADLAEAGWVVGHLADLDPADHHPRLVRTDAPLLLVVDYAETRTAHLPPLVTHLAQHPGGHRVRLLMLGRTDGDWWANLCRITAPAAVLRRDPLRLTVLEDIHDLDDAYRQATAALAGALSRIEGYASSGDTGPELSALPVVDWRALGGGHALSIHMAALAALLTHHTIPADSAGLSTAGGRRAEDVILDHEHAYWDRVADRRNLGLRSLRLSAVSAALLAGAATRTQATTTLALLPGLRGDAAEDQRRTLAAWIHDLYPSDHQAVGYWGTLQPDRLTEHHLNLTLTHQAEPELLDHLLPHLEHDQALHALTVLTRALSLPTAPDTIAPHLIRLITTHPHALALPAVELTPQAQNPTPLITALHTLTHHPDHPLPIHLNHQLHRAVPFQSLLLAGIALDLTTHQVAYYSAQMPAAPRGRPLRRKKHLARTHSDALANLAVALNDQANRLAQLGRREEALDAITRAVGILEVLAAERPDAFLRELATALNNQANRLAQLGRREEALDAITRATGTYEILAAEQPDAFLPDLAMALNNQANRLAQLGRREEALDAITRATGTYEILAAEQPDAFLPYLAGALNNQANCLAELRRREEALDAITRATGTYEILAAEQPDAFLPNLAGALNNQANRLAQMGRLEEALDMITRAVGIRELLAAERPDAFLPDLAGALNNQANCLAELRRREEALDAITRAIETYEKLAARWPDAFSSNLKNAHQTKAVIERLP